jgi:hypothetical protein
VTATFQSRSVLQCTIFVIAYLALALLVIFAAPAAFEDIPRPLAAWGKLLQGVVPSIGGFSRVTRFEAQAWLMLVAMWTFLPVAIWWVAKGDWVVSPDRNGMPARPSLVIVFGIVFMAMLVFMAVFEPSGLENAASRRGRAFARAGTSPIKFSLIMCLLFSGLAIALGSLPAMFRAHRRS